MKKLKFSKVAALLLAAVMGVTACGNGGNSNETTTKETTTQETNASDETTTAEETQKDNISDVDPSTIKIGMVTDVGGVNDGSFNQTSWEGLQRANYELGVTVKYLESKNDADYAPNIETFIDEEYDLIICVGYMLADATREAATNYPDQKFAIIDDASCADLPNVTCLMFEQAEASYLAGVVAGLATESNKVGFVLGMASEVMNQFGYGYIAGVKDTNPDAAILQYNANSFADAAAGKSAVTSMVTDGADVIFHAAGGTGSGVIEGCVENNIWAVGVDTDQSSLAPANMLTSALKRVDNACYDVVQSVLNNNLEAGVKTYDLASAGVDISPTITNLTDEMIAAVEQAKADIIAGKITVPSTKEAFNEKYGDIYELD